MPTEIAKQIVQQIFGDDKAKAIDATNDAVQQRKVEFAKSMGFELGDTAQDAADEIADKLPDGTEEPENVEYSGRKPEDPPADEVVDTAPSSIDPPTAEQEPTEEPKDETDS